MRSTSSARPTPTVASVPAAPLGERTYTPPVWKPSLKIVLAYAVTLTLWILASDWVAVQITDDAETLTRIQTAKGWGFAIVSSGLLFLLVKRTMETIQETAARAERSTELLRRIFERSPLGIVVVDSTGRYRQLNQAFADLLGYPKEELLGMHHRDVTYPDDLHATDHLYQHLRKDAQASAAVEKRYIRRDGSICWAHLTASQLAAHGAWFAVGIIKDITERKARESQLRESVDALREANEEKQQLLAALLRAEEAERRRIAGAIHDDTLQVMTSVLMGLDLGLAQEEGRLSETVRESSARLRRAMQGLRDLVFELRPVLLDTGGLGAALKLHLEEASGPASSMGWRVEDHLDEELPPPARLLAYRVAREALVNAVKHAAADEIYVRLMTLDGGAHVVVGDDGLGFEPATVRDSSKKSMGLSLMRERVEVYGGRFEIDSAPGAGTRVEFWIPRQPVSATAGNQMTLEDLAARPST